MEKPTKKILVVDDDLDLLMLLERKLMKEGYIVETAASVYEAKEILQVWKPHALLVDININGNDGRKLCGELKMGPNPIDAKVILISGYDHNLGIALLFGADELLAKPLNTEFLLHRLGYHLSATPVTGKA